MREHGRSYGITHFGCILNAVIISLISLVFNSVSGHKGELGFRLILIHTWARALFLHSIFGLGAIANILFRRFHTLVILLELLRGGWPHCFA
jgi:hypothetical protein